MNEEGSIHVIEAVLAGVVILSAVLFFTGVTNPSPAEAQSGIDLEAVAADTLKILQDRPPETNDCATDPAPCYSSRLEEIVDKAMQGEDEGKQFLDNVIPIGNRWLLRLDNGEEPLVLLPKSTGVAATPRAAKAAEVFLVPDWQALSGAADCDSATNLPPDPTFHPRGPETREDSGGTPVTVDVSPGDLLEAPTGAATAPDGTDWDDWWITNQPDSDTIPEEALYGWWRLDDGVNPPQCFFVGLEEGTATDRPLYGVQLVVWPIA